MANYATIEASLKRDKKNRKWAFISSCLRGGGDRLKMYKLCFYIPESHLEPVKKALFDKGAGRIGLYDHCCWQTLGEGQFRPLQGSTPFIGSQQAVERLAEYKVEMVCDDERVSEVVKELLNTHPYEEPAYEVYKILTAGNLC